MQPLHLHAHLQVRPKDNRLQVRPGLQLRPELRLRQLTQRGEALPPLRPMPCSRLHRRMARFAATRGAERIFMPIFILITRLDRQSLGFDR